MVWVYRHSWPVVLCSHQARCCLLHSLRAWAAILCFWKAHRSTCALLPLPPPCSFGWPLASQLAPYTVAPWTSMSLATPFPSRFVPGNRMEFCRHCGSRFDRAHSATRAMLRTRCSVLFRTVSASSSLPAVDQHHEPVPRSKWLWSRSGSTRRMSSASMMPGHSFATCRCKCNHTTHEIRQASLFSSSIASTELNADAFSKPRDL